MSSDGEDVWIQELSPTAGRGVSWCSHFAVSSKTERMPTFTPTIPFLGMYSRETLAHVHTKTQKAWFVSRESPTT